SQESKVRVQNGETVGHNQNPDRHHQNSADNFHRPEMTFESAVEGKELIQSKAGDHKRNTQSERIDGQKKYTLPHCLLTARNCKNAGKNGSEAWSPAKRKGETQYKHAPGTTRLFHVVKS